MDCPKKPCFDHGPSKGNNNVEKNMSHLYQNKPSQSLKTLTVILHFMI